MKLAFASSLTVLFFAQKSHASASASASASHAMEERMDQTSEFTVEFDDNELRMPEKSSPLSTIPEQKTVFCPSVDAVEDLYEGHGNYGVRTRFVVKNTATNPVVIAFVERNGTEVSASNSKITPAHLDPDALLDPGATKAFSAQEGHLFHVRDFVTGQLVMQHRAGLIPIENRYDHNISCSPHDDNANNNIMNKNNTVGRSYRMMRKFTQWKPSKIEQYNRPVDLRVGFRNNIMSRDGKSCPVNVYFVKKVNPANGRRKPNYVERFTTYLGDNHFASAQDNAVEASTKYEKTYIGHEFAARLASNDNVVVDYISIAPIRVEDCSNTDTNKEGQSSKSAAHANAIVIPVGGNIRATPENEIDHKNFVEVVFNSLSQNTTENRRGLYFQLYTS